MISYNLSYLKITLVALLCLANLSNIFGQQYAITTVNVVDVESGNVAVNQNILIDSGIITSIGKNTKIPKQYEVIDGKGQYIIPGLVDAHAHLPGPQGLDMPLEDYLIMQLASGVTRLRVMRYEEDQLAIRENIKKGNLIGPSLLLPAPAVYVSGSIDYTKADSLFRSYKNTGYDHLKYLNGLNAATHKSICTISKKHDLPFVGHLPRYVGLENALNAGQRGVEHFNGYFEMLGSDPDHLEELIIKSRELKVYNCPTLDWYNIVTPYIENALAVLSQRPGIEYLPDSLVNAWKVELKDNLAEQSEIKDNPRIELLKLFKKHQAPLLVGPGDGSFVIPGFSMFQEMLIYKEAGFTNREILQAATLNTARFYDKEEVFGIIKEGSNADLVLLSGNPLESLQSITKIQGVMTTNGWHSKKSLDKKLTALKRKNRN